VSTNHRRCYCLSHWFVINIIHCILLVTARNVELGNAAVSQLKNELGSDSSRLRFHQLDITDDTSIDRFADHIKKEHGGIDMLINNAGFAYKVISIDDVPNRFCVE
jgi:NAD(P)-dependent dehydrogenase (short-subunit alcohol dehydrogenase family)